MMEALHRDTARLASDQVVEVRFEDFEADPLSEIERIYDILGFEELPAARAAFDTYLRSTGGYRKNQYIYPEEDNAQVQRHWGALIERWHYAPPSRS